MLEGLGLLAMHALGSGTCVAGLACTPGGGLTTSIAAGCIYSLLPIDAGSYSTLSPNSNLVMKQGISRTPQVLTFTPPGTTGQSINYLVQAQYSETDGNYAVIPFYNQANSASPLTGAGGNNIPLPTERAGNVSLSLKAGTGAATGSQPTPVPDTGWTGLYVVTVAYGQAVITTGNIKVYAGAPFLTVTLLTALNQAAGDLRYLIQYLQTPTELTAGVTPSILTTKNGPMRYGAAGNGTTADQAAFVSVGKIAGEHFVPNGNYHFTAKAQIGTVVSIKGESLQNTIISSTAFADYVLEWGTSSVGPNPQTGILERLRFLACQTNTAILHLQALSHLSRLKDLLFQSSLCPALVIDSCWDSFYDNIDVYSCSSAGQAASVGASVIIRGSSNNLYFKGLHIEGAKSGALYIGICGPIRITQGKIDLGFQTPQGQPAITIDYQTASGNNSGGFLTINDYYIGGVNGQYAILCGGTLTLDNVVFGGGTGIGALISDVRQWSVLTPLNYTGIANLRIGPSIGIIDLGNSQFENASPNVNANTPAVVRSKVVNARVAQTLTVSANGSVSNGTIQVQTNLTGSINGLYNNCYMVHNPTGTTTAIGNPGSRRAVIQSYTNGLMVLAGTWGCTLDSDWSMENCGGHFTPSFNADSIRMDTNQTLFQIITQGATITTTPTYAASGSAGGVLGCTSFHLATTNPALGSTSDCIGFFLVDEATGEPFYLTYGIFGGAVATPYDRTATLNQNHTYSIVAGLAPNVKQVGSSYVWEFAGKRKTALISAMNSAGFDSANIPLWGFGTTGEPVTLPYSTSIAWDASQTKQPVIVATGAVNVGFPINLENGDIIKITIQNTSGASLTPTFATGYKMPTPTAITAGNGSTYDFFYDSTVLRQTNTPCLTPN